VTRDCDCQVGGGVPEWRSGGGHPQGPGRRLQADGSSDGTHGSAPRPPPLSSSSTLAGARCRPGAPSSCPPPPSLPPPPPSFPSAPAPSEDPTQAVALPPLSRSPCDAPGAPEARPKYWTLPPQVQEQVGVLLYLRRGTPGAHGTVYWAQRNTVLFPVAHRKQQPQPTAPGNSDAESEHSVLLYYIGQYSIVQNSTVQYCNVGPYLGQVGAEKARAPLHKGPQDGPVQHRPRHPGIQAGKGVVQENQRGRGATEPCKRNNHNT